MGDDLIQHSCHLICVVVIAHPVFGFFQGAMNEAILCIHDGSLGIFMHLLLNAFGSLVALLEDGFCIRQFLDILLYLLVVLQQFDAEISGGVTLAHVVICLKILLDVCYTVLYFMSMIDVDMSEQFAVGRLRQALRSLCMLIKFDNSLEEVFNSASCLEHRGHDRYSKQLSDFLVVDIVTAFLGLVIHV